MKPGSRSKRPARRRGGPPAGWFTPLALVLALAPGPALATSPIAAAQPAVATQPDLGSYAVTVNTRPVDGAVIAVRDASNRLYIDEAALRTWRVRYVDLDRISVDGTSLVAVDSIPGTRYEFDERRQAIALTIAPESLQGSMFGIRTSDGVPAAKPPPWGGFLNYSLFGYASSGDSYASGLFEAGVFGPQGTGIASFALNAPTAGGEGRDAVRLDTAWRRDDPGSLRTAVVGDTISRPGFYGRPMRIGGLQYGTNFGLQPGFVTTPMLALKGTATLPSTVDVFVNNQRVGSQAVEPGPFEITNVPTVSGSGSIQLVVRDTFGQQQVITQSFYGSPVLLGAGLDDFAFSVGAQRRNYGIESFDYDGIQASALWRRGLSDAVTVEGRVEADKAVRSAGGAADFRVGRLGIASAGLAASDGDDGSGVLGVFGFAHQGRTFSAGVRAAVASDRFRQVGDDELIATPTRNVAAHAAVNLGRHGSLGAAWVSQRFADPTRPAVDTGVLTWSTSLGALGALTLSVSRVNSPVRSTTVFAAVSIPLGKAGPVASATAAHDVSGGRLDRQTVSLQQPAPVYGEGFGYALYGDSDRRAQAGATLVGRRAVLRGEVADAAGTSAARVSVEGGIGIVGGHPFLSRPIVDSFALVSTAGVEGVSVMQENQPAGKTDSEGLLLITPLRAYLPNLVSVDPLSVPMGVSVGASTQRLTPMWRSGNIVEFDMRRGRSALVTLQLADGTPVPAGARVSKLDTGEPLPVGLDGQVFVSGLPDAGAQVRVEWNRSDCVVAVIPEGDDPVLELGPYRCGSARP
ncbi:MAG TPA: fimbria/pilus outer membrane usher protein [Zeimonas sp.]|nr:fimbria/pilus outer membrane usher protein [Zeimonas sp.]